MKHSSYSSNATHSRCPRRFYYRYLHSSSDASAAEKEQVKNMNKVFGLRELRGHLVHEALAKAAKASAEGVILPDFEPFRAQMLADFAGALVNSIPDDRQNLSAPRIAELVNRADAAEALSDTETLLNHFFDNGCEVLIALGLGKGDVVQVEQERMHRTKRGKFHLKMDLLFARNGHWYVVDWKTKKEITRQDRHQAQIYMECIRAQYRLSPMKITAILVSLWNGHLEKIRYDIFSDAAFSESESSIDLGAEEIPPRETASEITINAYPVNPSSEVCSACPYMNICQRGWS